MRVRKRSTSLYVRDISPNQCELGTLLCILGMEQLNYCLEKFCTFGDFIFKVSRSSLRFSLILKALVFVYAVWIMYSNKIQDHLPMQHCKLQELWVGDEKGLSTRRMRYALKTLFCCLNPQGYHLSDHILALYHQGMNRMLDGNGRAGFSGYCGKRQLAHVTKGWVLNEPLNVHPVDAYGGI